MKIYDVVKTESLMLKKYHVIVAKKNFFQQLMKLKSKNLYQLKKRMDMDLSLGMKHF
jgi:hypothetical protein